MTLSGTSNQNTDSDCEGIAATLDIYLNNRKQVDTTDTTGWNRIIQRGWINFGRRGRTVELFTGGERTHVRRNYDNAQQFVGLTHTTKAICRKLSPARSIICGHQNRRNFRKLQILHKITNLIYHTRN